MACGGHRWSWDELGFRGRRRVKNEFFGIDGRINNLQDSLSELISLSEIQLLALNVTFCVEQNFSTGKNCTQCVGLVEQIISYGWNCA